MNIVDQLLEIAYQHSFQVQPGFFLEHFGNRILRNEFVSETAIGEIEKSTVKLGGGQFLYETAKDFGYNYAARIPLPKANSILKDEYFKSLINFFETTYGRCSGYEIDWKNKKVKIKFKNFIVCRKNGIGIISIATFAGLLAFMFEDKTLEGIQTSCEGRGDAECVAVFGLFEDIKQNTPLKFSNIEPVSINPKYAILNRAIPTPADYGLELLTRAGVVKYQSSTFDVLGERFFPLEISFIPQLEKKLIENGIDTRKAIYTPTYNTFQNFAENNVKAKFPSNQNHLDVLCKLFSAFGWGYLQHLDNKITVRGFPWTELAVNGNPPTYFLASVDGFLSGLTGKQITTKLIQADTGTGSYSLVLLPEQKG